MRVAQIYAEKFLQDQAQSLREGLHLLCPRSLKWMRRPDWAILHVSASNLLLGYLKSPLLSINCCSYFLGNCVKKFGYFLFQHLVSITASRFATVHRYIEIEVCAGGCSHKLALIYVLLLSQDRQVHSQVGTQIGRYIDRYIDRQVGTQLGRYIDRQVHSQVGTQIGRYIGRQVHRQVHRQVGTQWDAKSLFIPLKSKKKLALIDVYPFQQ